MKTKVIIIGGGGHARAVISMLGTDGVFRIIGYTDAQNTGIEDINYLGTDGIIDSYKQYNPWLVLGIGKVDRAPSRYKKFLKLISDGYRFLKVVGRKAIVKDANIGDGTVVMDGAIVNTDATIGSASIINSGAIVEHDCVVGDNVHIATGAVLCGGVKVGNNCMIGANATIIQGGEVCDDVVIGAGSVVTEPISVPGIYAGVPARKIG